MGCEPWFGIRGDLFGAQNFIRFMGTLSIMGRPKHRIVQFLIAVWFTATIVGSLLSGVQV